MIHVISPIEIKFILHCYTTPTPCDSNEYPQEIIDKFILNKIIERKDNHYKTTSRGKAYVKVLCATEFPQIKWVDKDNREIMSISYLWDRSGTPTGGIRSHS